MDGERTGRKSCGYVVWVSFSESFLADVVCLQVSQEVVLESDCVGVDPAGNPCLWSNAQMNFDNFAEAAIVLFGIGTGEVGPSFINPFAVLVLAWLLWCHGSFKLLPVLVSIVS
jgi:hypothetical protein